MNRSLSWMSVAGLLGLVAAAPALAAPNELLATRQWKVGAGPSKATVIFLHGLGGQPDHMITGLIKEFQRRGDCFSVTAPWLRPVGVNEKGEIYSKGPHTMTDQLERARAIIRNEPGQVVLMGHSFGGKAAMKLAQEFPDKVRCVVALAPSVNMLYSYWKSVTGEKGLPEPAAVEARLAQERGAIMAKRDRLARDPSRDAQRQARHLSGEIGYLDLMRDVARYDEPKFEAALNKPTLWLHGTEDGAVSIHYARRVAEQNGAVVKLVEQPGAGHGFEVFKRGLDGEPELDWKASDRVLKNMAEQISDFIRQH